MPELPEVESVRRGLLDANLDANVVDVWRSDKALRQVAHGATQQSLQKIVGRTFGQLERRGKYLIWHIEGEPELSLIVHLGMSGRCGVSTPEIKHPLHTHLVVDFADGRQLRYVDPRRFGMLCLLHRSDLSCFEPIQKMGPEPWSVELDGEAFHQRLQSRSRPIRDVLLDQQIIAGIGNIYAVESLHAARIHPMCPANRVSSPQARLLLESLRDILERAIVNGGTTLKDFRNVSGEVGKNQDDLHVYGRAGKPCPRCGTALVGETHSGRSYVYCPLEQNGQAPTSIS